MLIHVSYKFYFFQSKNTVCTFINDYEHYYQTPSIFLLIKGSNCITKTRSNKKDIHSLKFSFEWKYKLKRVHLDPKHFYYFVSKTAFLRSKWFNK